MKLFKALCIFLCLVVAKTKAQEVYCPPSNIGFESGNFSNWECDTGHIDRNGNVLVSPTSAQFDRHTIYGKGIYPEIDPFGKFPTLCPYGGKYSIRLGNQDTARGAERISYNFVVPKGVNEYDLIFYYAVVLQDPPHLSFQQPRFTVKAFDVTDNTYVDCASFNFIASANLPGFQRAKDSVYFKDWSPSTLHLQGYGGKQMRLEFTTNDCTLGRHFGYAYIDVNEDCGSPITGNAYCSNQKSATLLGPGGFGAYTWYNSDLSQPLAFTRGLYLSPPPPNGTRYAVVLTPFNGLGCTDTLYTTVNKIDANLIFNVPDTLRGCVGAGADLTASSVTAGSSPNLTLSYYTDELGTQYLFHPEKILTSGTYYIKAVNAEGCINVRAVNVDIRNPTLTVTDPVPVTFPVTVDLSAVFEHNANYSYNYYTDSAATRPVADYQHIAHTGVYYVQAVNSTGCTTERHVNVTVTPPPPPVIKSANTFTPNNDGINDFFTLTITGFGEFGSLKIYNRFGLLIFESRSQNNRWDGKFNGKPANTGTYYWVFEGKNTYYNTKVTESGFIALIR